MNKIYKVIWSKTRNCYVAVSEIAKRNGKDRTSVTGGAAGSRQAARVLCALLLGVYLTAGYSMPVAWGEDRVYHELYVHGLDTSVNSSYSDTASVWGYGTYAGATGATAWGNHAHAENEYATAWGNYTSAANNYATAWGNITVASGDCATAWGSGYDNWHKTVASGNFSTAFGFWTEASGQSATAWGGYSRSGTETFHGGTARGEASTAFGVSTTANTEGSTAWGNGTIAGTDTGLGTGNYATAWGNASKATGNYATAFGDSSTADAANSLAALGATVSAANSAAIGKGATASLADTVALGSGAVANIGSGVAGEYKPSTVPTGKESVWTSTKNAIAVGDASNNITRQITGVAAGKEDTDAVNVAQLKAAATGGGTTYTAGDGIAIDTSNNTISVKANTGDSGDFKFESGTLNLKKDGAVASGNTGLVTGGTVFTAIQAETRVASNGNYIKAANSAAANLSALDTQVKTNATAIAGKADKATTLSGYGITDAYTKTAADNKFAQKATTLSGYGITDAAMVDASNIDATAWGTKLGTGAVASGDEGLVTGGKVYTEVRPANGTYVKKANTTAANLKALDTQVKANTDAIADKADASVVSELTDMVGANEKAIEKNANDISSLGTKVTANETALAKKADKANTLKGYGIEDAYTKEETDTLLNKKADKTALAEVKATADSNKEALAALGDVKELAKDTETIKKIADDVETVVSEQNGVVADGKVEEDANELVRGATVYDFLNGESLVIGEKTRKIAVGSGSAAMGNQSIAIGFGNKVSGNNSGAFGDPNNISGDGSYAVGNNNTISGNNTFVLGSNVTADVDDAVVLGNKSTAESGAVSVGSDGSERQIKHVADGTDDADAATVGQMNRAIEDAVGTNMVNMSNSINKLDSRINKVGAGAAALAALHPIDTDDKFTMGLGYGNYRSAHSAAIGMFYRPTEKIMLSVGGAIGNGENMINAGISFAMDKGKGFGTSKAAMARKIAAQDEEIAALKEAHAKENAENKAEIQALKEALARLEAKIGK